MNERMFLDALTTSMKEWEDWTVKMMDYCVVSSQVLAAFLKNVKDTELRDSKPFFHFFYILDVMFDLCVIAL
jgi:hypothetical protein